MAWGLRLRSAVRRTALPLASDAACRRILYVRAASNRNKRIGGSLNDARAQLRDVSQLEFNVLCSLYFAIDSIV